MTSMLRMPNYGSSGSARERRIGVPFAPSHSASDGTSNQQQQTASSVTTSISHSVSAICKYYIPYLVDNKLYFQWTPIKIRHYEREERNNGVKRPQSKFQLMAPPSAMPGTPLASTTKTPRKSSAQFAGLPPDEHRHDRSDLLGSMGDFSADSSPARSSRLRPRSQSETSSATGETSSTSGSSRQRERSLQQSALKNAASVMDGHLSSRQFAFLPESRLLFSCGHWDHSLRATSVETGRIVQSVCHHSDVITCVALAKDFGQSWLVTGSRDCTLAIWAVHAAGDKEIPLGDQPLHILYGHDDAVTSVAVNAEIDVVVSGSEDGTIIIHNLRDGSYVRSIIDGIKGSAGATRPQSLNNSFLQGSEQACRDRSDTMDEQYSFYGAAASGMSTPGLVRTSSQSTMTSTSSAQQTQQQLQHRKITWIGLSKENYIVSYSSDDHLLCTYSLNGFQIATRTVPEALYAFLISEDGKVLITGGSSCLVVFRWVRVFFLD
jgi:WD40 repeat protein